MWRSRSLRAPQNPPPRCSGPQPLGRLWELSGGRVFVFILIQLNAGEATANCPCTEETNEIQVASEEELPRDRLGLRPEPGRERAVEADAPAAGRGPGGAGAVGQTARAPAARLAGPENRDAEDLERDQLVIPDGQEEEEQDAAEEGGCAALWVVCGLRSAALRRPRAGPLRRAPLAIWWFLLAGSPRAGGREEHGRWRCPK